MIYNSNGIFGKVWKATHAENGKYIDLQMTTYERNDDGEYVNSSWFPRVIGHAVNSLKNVKEGDRIKITKSKFTNERYENKDGKMKSSFKFLIFEAEIMGDRVSEQSSSNDSATNIKQQAAVDETQDDCPW